jgi:hypothetical protein
MRLLVRRLGRWVRSSRRHNRLWKAVRAWVDGGAKKREMQPERKTYQQPIRSLRR